jgi:hypothetical protein
MPIRPFSDIVNPYSVNQTYFDNAGNIVYTGTGYAVIARLLSLDIKQLTGSAPTQGESIIPGTTAGIDNTVWRDFAFNCNGQPSDPSFTAFFDSNDYVNTDLNLIAAKPQMWEEGQFITYMYETPAMTALNQYTLFIWKIVEVIDEATYNSGAGNPAGWYISQSSYGVIPVGVISPTFGDPNCNGCSSVYNETGATVNQGLANMATPGYLLEHQGTLLNNPQTIPAIFMDGVTHQQQLVPQYTRGFYIGSNTSLCGPSESCRNPNAVNFDTTTSSYFVDISNNFYIYADEQKDCNNVNYVPSGSQYATGGYGDESCCLYKTPSAGSGCGDGDTACGCLDPNAVNFCSGCLNDCVNVVNGSDVDCCKYYHEWKYCGSTNMPPWAGVTYYNFTGNLTNSGNNTLANTPDNNEQFMNYYTQLPGSPYASALQVPVGTVMRMRSIGSPGSYYCMEYQGTSTNTADFNHPGDGTGYNSWSWWNYPPSVVNNQLEIPADCALCVTPATNFNPHQYENCATGEIINIINSWATDPQDEMNNAPVSGPLFYNEVDASNFNCSSCNQSWMLAGMVLSINVPAAAGFNNCWIYTGLGGLMGNDTGGWIEGVGAGTDNFLRVDPSDITQLQDISDDCDSCVSSAPCNQICTDPSALNYVAGPWSSDTCDCNGDGIGTQAAGWNDCCSYCDNGCNDPDANNYDAAASGCCDGVNCCTYNWSCDTGIPAFNSSWPETDSTVIQSKTISAWNEKFGIRFTDANPRPSSAWNHTNDTGYVWSGLAYLNTSLNLLLRGGLGLNINDEYGGQGWGSGKQPSSYISSPDQWNFATDFMDKITGPYSGSKTDVNGTLLWDMDLTKSYYKVKTNMIQVLGQFTNGGSKVITESIPGGTVETGLYYHIIPTGALTIPTGFERTLVNTSGKTFNTWRKFITALAKDGLPEALQNEVRYTDVSNWVISTVSESGNKETDNNKAAIQFQPQNIQWMVASSSNCVCIPDSNGPYSDEAQCQSLTTIPSGSGSGSSNCCACIYGCTDSTAFNFDPLATCDDGSCLECEPLVIKNCVSNTYMHGYLCDNQNSSVCWMTPATCANSIALKAEWGFVNYGDVVHVDYTQANDPNPSGTPDYEACYQYIDPTDPDYLAWISSNTPSHFQASQQIAILANHAPGLVLTNTPYDGNSNQTTCQVCGETPGCTDPFATNYDINATIDDGSCVYCVYGCTDPTTLVGGFPDINGYDSTASYTCSNSTTVPMSSAVLCPYPCATGYLYSNYIPCATCDDGTCFTPTYHDWTLCGSATILSITAPGSQNDYASQEWFYQNVGSPSVGQTINIVSGDPSIKTCYTYSGPSATNTGTILSPLPLMVDWVYGQTYNADCTTCTCIYGCTDDSMCNYDALATCDDGSCCNLTGCLDATAFNYCSTCCCAGPCEAIVSGCMDQNANNYDPAANTQCPHCCDYTVIGCTDPTAVNYNPLANTESTPSTCSFLNQCKRQPREFGSNPTKKLDIECSFASDVYKEYRKERYGLSNYCGSDLPDHLNQKVICDWEDSKRPAYLSSTITVLDKYSYPLDNKGEINWFDTLRPIWTSFQCGLTPDVDIDMYFNYDTTSMGLAAIQNQRQAIEAWVAGMDVTFGGNIYHTLVFGERWLDWGTAMLTGVWNNSGSCGGVNTGCTPGAADIDHGLCPCAGSASDAVALINSGSQMSVNNKFWSAVGWGNTSSRDWYAAMDETVTNGSLTHLGFPPQLSKSQILNVNFADESAAGNIVDGCVGGMAQPYHASPGPVLYGTTEWKEATDGSGSAQNGSDATITPCWKADYDTWILEYNKHLARGIQYKATMVIYPCKPIGAGPSSNSQTAFPLHVLGGVSSGNNNPKDGRYGISTRPQNDIVDLKRIEEGNPYWDTNNPNQPVTHTSGYGGLDNYGWIANVRERSFDAAIFKEELEGYWDPNRLVCDGSECIIANVVNQNNVAIPDYDIYLDGGFMGKTDEFGRITFSIPNAGVKTNHILNLCLCINTTGNCSQQNIKIIVQEDCPPQCCAEPTGVSCETYVYPTQVFEGCTDVNASNYNPMATVNDGTCLYCDPLLVLTETHINVSTQGASDGSITITVTNGTIPLTFAWSNGATTQNLTGIAGGTYTLIVTDSRSCSSTIIVRVNEDPDIYGCLNNDAGYWPNVNGLNQASVNCSYPCSNDGTDTGTPEGYKYFCYDPDATLLDTCCEAGCTDSSAINFCNSCEYDCNQQDINEPGYTQTLGWDSCCQSCRYGCTNPSAGNYDAAANCDDGSCVFYYSCIDAYWGIDQVTNSGYTLSNWNNTGLYMDNTCNQGYCDSSSFFHDLAVYYSSGGSDTIAPGSELTMVDSSGASNSMSFLYNSCPAYNLDNTLSTTLPLGTIGGYTTENPYGPTAAGSCYFAQQIADFGANYVFPTWDAYRDWHNNGINGSAGPQATCSGTQIHMIPGSGGGANIDTENAIHSTINIANGGNGDMYAPTTGENWIYFTSHVPECSGYTDCECQQILEGVGNHSTLALCEADITTCCGFVAPPAVGGCIDNGYVGQHANFGAQGATTEQEWWNGMNGAGQNYALANIPMLTCVLGITPVNQIGNGGSGTYGTGSQPSYPSGVAAYNYDPNATFDDGSCCYCSGCMDDTTMANNYEEGACYNDGSCVAPIYGCTDPDAFNHYVGANADNGTCEYIGCMDATSSSYQTFEHNGLYSHTWAGVTYGWGDISYGCTTCCTGPATLLWGCVNTAINNPTFTDGFVTNLVAPLDFPSRFDLSTAYEVPDYGYGTGPQTMSDFDNYNSVWTVSTFGTWSRAPIGSSYANFDSFYFWFANNGNHPCNQDQGEMDSLYSQTGWTNPSGIGGFTIGNNAATNMTANVYARPQIILAVQIYKWHPTNGTTTLSLVSVGDVDTSFQSFRDIAIVADNLDGSDPNKPNISGKDWNEIWDIFNQHAVGPDGYTYEIAGVLEDSSCGSGEEKMCLPIVGGTQITCDKCQSTLNCGVCI